MQAGQQGKPKVTGRRSQLLSVSARAELRRAGSSAKSEDSASAAATDSEADSITTDGGSHKRKPSSKKGARRRLHVLHTPCCCQQARKCRATAVKNPTTHMHSSMAAMHVGAFHRGQKRRTLSVERHLATNARKIHKW